jgi:hypothetical protein
LVPRKTAAKSGKAAAPKKSAKAAAQAAAEKKPSTTRKPRTSNVKVPITKDLLGHLKDVIERAQVETTVPELILEYIQFGREMHPEFYDTALVKPEAEGDVPGEAASPDLGEEDEGAYDPDFEEVWMERIAGG